MSHFDDDSTYLMLFSTKVVLWGSVLLGLSVIVFGSMIMAVRPAWMGFERRVMKESHQYVEAKETMLLQWVDEYNGDIAASMRTQQ